MPRLSKRKAAPEPETTPQTDAVVGRDIIEQHQRESEAAADLLTEGEAVTYYNEGWRYGHVETLPASDEPKYGQVRIIHQTTGRVWIAARDVRRLK
jgi:hypothetical protein